MSTLLVTTPTGHIGGRVIEQLLATGGHTVRVLARDPGRLAPEVRAAVDARTGTLEDAAAVAEALGGVEVAFFLIPPTQTEADWRGWQRALGRTFADAARQAGVRRVVFLSSQGAHRDDLGPVSGLGEVEGILRDVLPDLVVLRPGYFFENAFGALPTVRQAGAVFGAFDPDLPIAQVATRDIGDVAARWLTDPSWHGHHIVGVHGPRDLTMAEQAATIGAVLGQPVAYTQVPPEVIAQAMAGMGMSPSVVAGYTAMLRGYQASRFEHPEARTPETTTPTEFAVWAREALPPAYAAAEPATAAA